MSVDIVNKNLVKNPEIDVSRINNTIDGWSRYTYNIVENFIKEDNFMVFDFAKPKTATDYSGYSIVCPSTEKSDAGYLLYMAVEKGMQNQGLGSQLLQATVEKVKRCACTTLMLHCRERSLGFYKKFAEKNHYPLTSKLMPYNPVGTGNYYALTLTLSKEKLDEKRKESSSSSCSSSSSSPSSFGQSSSSLSESSARPKNSQIFDSSFSPTCNFKKPAYILMYVGFFEMAI